MHECKAELANVLTTQMVVNCWLLASTETCDYFTPTLGLYQKTNREYCKFQQGYYNFLVCKGSVGLSLPHLHLNSYVIMFNDIVRNSPFRMYSVHKEPKGIKGR